MGSSLLTTSSCVICKEKITRSRLSYTGTKICCDCITNINNDTYDRVHANVRRYTSNDIDRVDGCGNEILLEQKHGENSIIVVDDSGREITCTCTENIPIYIENTQSENTNVDFKDALLASLYSQVEFLRKEIEEKNLFIRTLLMRENDVYMAFSTTGLVNTHVIFVFRHGKHLMY